MLEGIAYTLFLGIIFFVFSLPFWFGVFILKESTGKLTNALGGVITVAGLILFIYAMGDFGEKMIKDEQTIKDQAAQIQQLKEYNMNPTGIDAQ